MVRFEKEKYESNCDDFFGSLRGCVGAIYDVAPPGGHGRGCRRCDGCRNP
jgi:hypothetical protein